jgi:NAD(P)-dependent dehydrogenase (short-subunit alcohol dehydrogenase family)
MSEPIVITGGGTGIGKALALRLAQQKRKVYVVGRRETPLELVRREFPKQVTSIVADVGTEAGRAAIADVIEAPLDVLVHNAAVLGPVKPLLEMTPEEWREHMAINLEGPWFLTQKLLPVLRAGSRVLHISSGAAHRAVLGWGNYCVSKAALHSLYLNLRDELAGQGILVGSVRPGIVDTPMQQEIRDLPEEAFPLVEQFRAFAANGDLESPQRVGQFLHWLLEKVPPELFVGSEWDIRDPEWVHEWTKFEG